MQHENTPNPKGFRSGPKGLVGARPSDLTAEQFAELGHDQTNPVKAIRRKCVDCMGGSIEAIRDCMSTNCALWPFRMGRNPFRAAPTEAQMESARANADRLRSLPRRAADKTSPAADEASR